MSQPSPSSVRPADIVLKLVESVGRSSDADFYVQLFRKLPKSAFAIVAPGSSSLNAAQGLMVEHLRFLHQLGLHAVVVLGLIQPENAQADSTGFAARLREAGLAVNEYSSNKSGLSAQLHRDLSQGETPVVSFDRTSTTNDASRFAAVGSWAKHLRSRKLVLVRAQGGLGPQVVSLLDLGDHHRLPTTEKGISIINLRRDLQPLLDSGRLPVAERHLLTGINSAMAAVGTASIASEQMVTSVTSPTNLLHELFTVKGAGTLIKPGVLIQPHAGYDSVDTAKLRALLETTFNRPLHPSFFKQVATAVYLEPEYRGAAIVREGRDAAFLTKFVVGRLAQGLGLGRDLWDAVCARHPSLYWRSRPDNPITPWYEGQCEGRTRSGDWVVYWRGVSHDSIPRLIDSALEQPVDFEVP